MHRGARALERLVVPLPLRRMDDRWGMTTSKEQEIHEQARDLATISGERENPKQVVVGARGQAHGCARSAKLWVIDPVDELPQLVGDLVRRNVLVKIKAMLRDVLSVFDRFYVALFGMQNAVNPLYGVDGHRRAAPR